MSNECEGDFNLLWRNATIAELSYCRQSLHFIFNIQLSGMFLINLHQHNWHSLQGQLQPWLHEITKFLLIKIFLFFVPLSMILWWHLQYLFREILAAGMCLGESLKLKTFEKSCWWKVSTSSSYDWLAAVKMFSRI